MAVNVVSFSFFWCSTGALGSTLLGAGFLYCILSASSLDPNSIRAPKGPFGLMWLSLPHLVYNSHGLQLNRPLTQLSYIIVRRPLLLWNRMFNRYQAEITVMQFRGHSLPVHHSVVAQWDLHLVPYYPPTWSLSITGHWNVSLPSGASHWNSILGWVEGQNITLSFT